MKLKLAIVVVTFNRPNSLNRLLTSLKNASYADANVDLIISIDNSGNDETYKLADKFSWDIGNKIVIKHPTRLGLRTHILKCGDHLDSYDAISVFEDDIYASPGFFSFMQQAVSFYKDDDNIAGISLYSPLWSEYNSRPFTPMKGSHDVYFLQYAQSWGQIWMKKQWFEFKKWYENNIEIEIKAPNIPKNVSNWPSSSWLKYHIKYCIENNKYFVYPYVSLSTNFTEIGHHNNTTSTTYQVPILYEDTKNYSFIQLTSNNSVIYDVFFERKNIGKFFNINNEELCIELYGKKDSSLYKRYLLTMELHDFKVIKKYGLLLRPHEMNALLSIPGDSITLYEVKSQSNKNQEIDLEIKKWLYDFKTVNYHTLLKIIIRKFLSKLTPIEIWLSLIHRLKKILPSN